MPPRSNLSSGVAWYGPRPPFPCVGIAPCPTPTVIGGPRSIRLPPAPGLLYADAEGLIARVALQGPGRGLKNQQYLRQMPRRNQFAVPDFTLYRRV